jgi:hypothetical protein
LGKYNQKNTSKLAISTKHFSAARMPLVATPFRAKMQRVTFNRHVYPWNIKLAMKWFKKDTETGDIKQGNTFKEAG